MTMSRNILIDLAALFAAFLFCANNVSGQAYGSYAPYSIYGVGDVQSGGTAYNNTMGGVGVASRDHRFINPLNPAAVTARDSLAFMADFSIYSTNKTFNQADMRSSNNATNIGDMIISFPIYRSSAMMVGVRPFSGTGYGYTSSYTDPNLVAHMGDITYAATGKGALSQVFVSAGVTFFKNLSFGVEADYYFGNVSKSYYESISDASYLGASNGYDMSLDGLSGKVGIQYTAKLGKKLEMTAGATYRLPVNLEGELEAYRYSTGSAATDTLYYRKTDLGSLTKPISIPEEFTVGISLKSKDKWMAEFDYSRSDWTGSAMDGTEGFSGNLSSGTGVFRGTLNQSFRAGFEYIPNRGDMRYYFNNCAYRAGLYYRNEYYKLDGRDISSMGLTFGLTLPVFRWYNGLTLGVEIGRRGTTSDNLIKENYVNFSVGVNIFDIWFQKPKYD